MYLKIKNDIENNIFSTLITVDSFGTEQLSEDEEQELLRDFPSKLSYRSLDFAKKIKLEGTVPVVADDNDTEEDVVLVKLPALSNKEIPIDSTFEALYKIDINKIAPSALDEKVLTSKELTAQAYCTIFSAVVCEAIQDIMNALRAKAPSFTSEVIVGV